MIDKSDCVKYCVHEAVDIQDLSVDTRTPEILAVEVLCLRHEALGKTSQC